MAHCTQYSSFTVTGAGTSSANGTYIPAGVGGRGNTIFTKDGTLSYPRITVDGSGQGQWAILGNAPFPGAPFYSAPSDSYGSNDCPAGLNWTETAFGVSPAPTVTGTEVNGGGGGSSSTLKIAAGANVKLLGKVKVS